MFEYFLLLTIVLSSGDSQTEEVAIYSSSVRCNAAKAKMIEYTAPLQTNADVVSYAWSCEGWKYNDIET